MSNGTYSEMYQEMGKLSKNCFLATRKDGSSEMCVARKLLVKNDSPDHTCIQQEAKTLKKLNHEHIVEFKDYFVNAGD